MKQRAPKVQIHLYQLPHLFGIWIADPWDKETEQDGADPSWIPTIFMFLGDRFIIRIETFPDEDEPGETVSHIYYYVYELDGPDLFVQGLEPVEKDRLERTEIVKLPWAITDEIRLYLTIQDQIFRYAIATREDLEAAGVDLTVIDQTLRNFRESGVEIIEKFDLDVAQDLIAEKQAREETEN